MSFEAEVRNLRQIDVSPERPWLKDLQGAYSAVQRVVNGAFLQAMPEYTFPQAAPIIVVPDKEFNAYIIAGVENAVQGEVHQDKSEDIVKDGKAMVSAMYLNHLGAIILPRKTAEAFHNGGVEAAAVRCVLAEEYVHHMTTVVGPDNIIERMGLYPFGDTQRVTGEYQPGKIYLGSIGVQEDTVLPEAAGDSNVLLTENATTLLVHLLAKELVGKMLDPHMLLSLQLRGKEDDQDHVLIEATDWPAITQAVIKAMMHGDEKQFNISCTNIILPEFSPDIHHLVSDGDTVVFVVDPMRTTGIDNIDMFSYESRENYRSFENPQNSQPAAGPRRRAKGAPQLSKRQQELARKLAAQRKGPRR